MATQREELTYLYSLMDDRLEYVTPSGKYANSTAESLQALIDDARARIQPEPPNAWDFTFNKLAYSRLLHTRATHSCADAARCVECRRFAFLTQQFRVHKTLEHNARLNADIVAMRSELLLRRVKELEASISQHSPRL